MSLDAIDSSCGPSPYGCCYGNASADSVREQEPAVGKELSKEETEEVKELEKRDREVRTHEMAHVAAGGQYVQGGARFEYQSGPDGKRYAVGGEVSIDTSSEKGDPEATIRKMQVVRKAALAPAKPSASDRAIAAKAAQAESKARMELREVEKQQGQDSSSKTTQTAENTKAPEAEAMVTYTRFGTAVPANTAAPEMGSVDFTV